MNHRGRWGTAGSAGVTFFEVAVVLTLIGVLLTLAILAAQRFIQRAKASATANQMAFVKDGLLSFAASCEGLPLSSASGGDPGLAYPPTNTPCWSGPYSGAEPGEALRPSVDDGDGVTLPREVVAHGGGDIAIIVDDEDGFGIHAKTHPYGSAPGMLPRRFSGPPQRSGGISVSACVFRTLRTPARRSRA